MRRSIRWELPLSYAAIALLATVALGAILLLTLRDHYGQLEQSYLDSTAQAFSYTLAPLLDESAPPGSLQAQLASLAFLSQARVRVLDEEGALLADSGAPGRFPILLASVLHTARSAPAQENGAVVVVGPDLRETLPLTFTQALSALLLLEPNRSDVPGGRLGIRAVSPITREWPLVQGSETSLSGRRSGRIALRPVYRSAGDLLGYVELSGGPAYEQEIVTSVARGWALAGVLAVGLAGAAGWLVSRRISGPLSALTGITASMAAGDLTARAGIRRRDEFGTLARSFNGMADRVEGTVLTLRRFVSDAAHELNTPLATLRANLEMMREDNPPGQAERVARAQAQVEQLEVLTRGMLDLSRIEAGAGQSVCARVSLAALAQEMGELYASRAEQVGLEFDLSLPDTPVTIQGNQTQLRTALANLLDNAIKFTPEGGHVKLGLDRAEGVAVLWVEDTGIGIPEQDLPHLFQRFHRGHNTGGYPGSGLGLAIVKAIVDAHGGRVEAERTETGSRFSLHLPDGSSCVPGLSPGSSIP